jgi:hypothetical protein
MQPKRKLTTPINSSATKMSKKATINKSDTPNLYLVQTIGEPFEPLDRVLLTPAGESIIREGLNALELVEGAREGTVETILSGATLVILEFCTVRPFCPLLMRISVARVSIGTLP